MRLVSQRTLIALIVVCAASFGHGKEVASPAWAGKVDAAVQHCLAHDEAPSASVAIVLDGRVAYVKSYGQAHLAPALPATVATRYQLASLSKTFTAQALLCLEQDGKLSLNDPVGRWLPGLTGADQVKLRQLLNHTAGYPDHYPQSYPAGPRARPVTPDQLLAEWGHHPLLFAPGSQWRYSNLNYVVAGRIAEKAAEEPLFQFMQRRIFAPLGMGNTVDLDDPKSAAASDAIGYERPALAMLQHAPAEGRGWSFAAGQVVSTAGDVARWDAAFLEKKLLAPAQSEEEVTPPKLPSGALAPYALGLFVSKLGGRTAYSNVGQGLGFLAINRLYPDERAAVVVLTNTSASPAFRHIADAVEYIVVPASPADAAARVVFLSLQRGEPERARLSADFNAYLDADRVKAYAQSLGPLGEPQSFILRDETVADGLVTRTYEIIAGDRRLSASVLVLPNGQIEQFIVKVATGS
jgi:CubicO group peptidase (beta-lactamase class C family)